MTLVLALGFIGIARTVNGATDISLVDLANMTETYFGNNVDYVSELKGLISDLRKARNEYTWVDMAIDWGKGDNVFESIWNVMKARFEQSSQEFNYAKAIVKLTWNACVEVVSDVVGFGASLLGY